MLAPMSNPRRFLIKVDAIGCPDEVGRPESAVDWERKKFKTGTPQQSSAGEEFPAEHTRNPEPGDRLLIWVNDGKDGGGTGLTAMAEVGAFQADDGTVVARHVGLFQEPRLGLKGQLKPVVALHDLAKSRGVRLRFLPSERWNAIREAAALKIAEAETQVSGNEGKRRWRKSAVLERTSKLGKLAKEANRKDHDGVYQCEACDFSAEFPSLFDAHHLSPLCLGERKTEVHSFAVLCPTCHRLAHDQGQALYHPLTVPEIKSWLLERQANGMGAIPRGEDD
jgi:hypothetical protein